jgi:hypothetical protein
MPSSIMQGFESHRLKITALLKALKIFRFLTKNSSGDGGSGTGHPAEISISEAITVMPSTTHATLCSSKPPLLATQTSETLTYAYLSQSSMDGGIRQSVLRSGTVKLNVTKCGYQ